MSLKHMHCPINRVCGVRHNTNTCTVRTPRTVLPLDARHIATHAQAHCACTAQQSPPALPVCSMHVGLKQTRLDHGGRSTDCWVDPRVFPAGHPPPPKGSRATQRAPVSPSCCPALPKSTVSVQMYRRSAAVYSGRGLAQGLGESTWGGGVYPLGRRPF